MSDKTITAPWIEFNHPPHDGTTFEVIDNLNNGEPIKCYYNIDGELRALDDGSWMDAECYTHWREEQ